jgi:HD-GYP domain-containing protein (c-di-GMP phosphodiesterase class II)/DNA-binding CsgD family transcriptional regulator
MPMVRGGSAEGNVRLAEVVASLSLATGLCTGQPIEHGLRRGLLAVWLGEELGLGAAELSDAYYVALLGSVGCTVEQTLFAKYAKDDIALNAKTLTIDPTSRLQAYTFGLRNFGAGERPLRRAGTVLAAIRSGGPAEFQAVCRDVAQRIGEMLDIGPTIQQALTQCHETWNGRGGPRGLKAEEIALEARIFHVAADAEICGRMGGVEAAVARARRQAGSFFDPAVADRFCAMAEDLFGRLETQEPWDAVMAAEPAPLRWLSGEEADNYARTIANFVDLRSPYTLGHSTGVGWLAEHTARRLGLSEDDAVALRRAGYLHDIGRIGVPAGFWNTPTPWRAAEWDRAKQHPALTELVLARSTALGHLGMLAGLHHERLDGSGYRGVRESFLPVAARILAAADTYHAKIEPRPHREALAPDAAGEEIRSQVQRGGLDGDVAEALLAAAGHPDRAEPTPEPPGDLSDREVEVLRLMVRGLSNRRMAEILFISTKTVGHHVEHIYNKLGISTRVGATLFAIEHGLVPGHP